MRPLKSPSSVRPVKAASPPESPLLKRRSSRERQLTVDDDDDDDDDGKEQVPRRRSSGATSLSRFPTRSHLREGERRGSDQFNSIDDKVGRAMSLCYEV